MRAVARTLTLCAIALVLASRASAHAPDASSIGAIGTRQRPRVDALDDWKHGRVSGAEGLTRYATHARRLLHACAPPDAWDAAEGFMESLDASLGGAEANANALFEFNSLEDVRAVDVSVRMDYHASARNGVLERLVTCDPRAGRGVGAWCLGLERSSAFERHRRWWRRLRERYEDGRHPYWLSEYMEFDMSENEIDPTASVFIEHLPSRTGRDGEYVAALREYLEALEARTSEQLFENVRRVVDVALGDDFDAHMWAAGIMFSRSSEAAGGAIESVRLLISFDRHLRRTREADDAIEEDEEDEEDGYRSEKTRQMVRFLEMLHWSGDYDEFDRIDDYFLDDGGIGSVLQVDVLAHAPTEDEPSIIGPRVGVEITVGVANPSKNIMPRLNTLVDDGLVDAAWWRNFTGALCSSGKPVEDASTARSRVRRPCAVRRRTAADKRELRKPDGSGLLPMLSVAVSHLKFIVQPGRRLHVKAYVVAQHPFRYCLDAKAYAAPGSLPSYAPCER